MENTRKASFHDAWVVLIATVLMNFFYSIVFSSFSLYAASILEKYPDISRTAYSRFPHFTLFLPPSFCCSTERS